jgi:hypothetical protein
MSRGYTDEDAREFLRIQRKKRSAMWRKIWSFLAPELKRWTEIYEEVCRNGCKENFGHENWWEIEMAEELFNAVEEGVLRHKKLAGDMAIHLYLEGGRIQLANRYRIKLKSPRTLADVVEDVAYWALTKPGNSSLANALKLNFTLQRVKRNRR